MSSKSMKRMGKQNEGNPWFAELAIMKRHLTILCAVSVFSAAATGGQIGIANSFAAMSVGSKIITDDAGNVVKFAVSRHAAKDTAAMPPGVGDAESGDILKLPKLDAVFIEMMPLSDASYALHGQLKSIKDVRIHYPTQSKPLPNSAPFKATERFAQFLNQLPGLRVLQLKHSFGMNGDGMADLAPQPGLEHLEIDTVCAKASAVPFVIAATKPRNLQAHRCEWKDANLQRGLGPSLQLEVLELKPNKMPKAPIAARSLRGLANCPRLRLVGEPRLRRRSRRVCEVARAVTGLFRRLQRAHRRKRSGATVAQGAARPAHQSRKPNSPRQTRPEISRRGRRLRLRRQRDDARLMCNPPPA